MKKTLKPPKKAPKVFAQYHVSTDGEFLTIEFQSPAIHEFFKTTIDRCPHGHGPTVTVGTQSLFRLTDDHLIEWLTRQIVKQPYFPYNRGRCGFLRSEYSVGGHPPLSFLRNTNLAQGITVVLYSQGLLIPHSEVGRIERILDGVIDRFAYYLQPEKGGY